MNWYLAVLKKYAVFNGRACRAEYWYYVLFTILVSIGLVIVDSISGSYNATYGLGMLSGLYSLAVLIPGLAVTVRRLHDTGRSGWWLLIGLIPLLGGIVLLVFMIIEGTAGSNEHGPNPIEATA